MKAVICRVTSDFVDVVAGSALQLVVKQEAFTNGSIPQRGNQLARRVEEIARRLGEKAVIRKGDRVIATQIIAKNSAFRKGRHRLSRAGDRAVMTAQTK